MIARDQGNSYRRFIEARDDLSKAVLELSREFQMALKLQGIASKMAMLQHNVELDAEKLDAAIDAAEARRVEVMPKASAVIAGTHKTLADVDTFISSIDAVTNGAPEKITDESAKTPVPPNVMPKNPSDPDLNQATAHYHDKVD